MGLKAITDNFFVDCRTMPKSPGLQRTYGPNAAIRIRGYIPLTPIESQRLEAVMKFARPSSTTVSRSPRVSTVVAAKRCIFMTLVLGIQLASAWAQQSSENVIVDKQTLQALVQRIGQLEARVSQLEAARSAPAPAPASAPAQGRAALVLASSSSQATPAPPQPLPQEEPMEPEKMDVSKTLLNIRGFGDVGLYGGNQKGQTTSFSLGEMNLFITSNISDRFKFLSELVFESASTDRGLNAGQVNVFKAEPERLLLEYSYNDHLNLSIGRYHSAIGYYNTAYHHSAWLQTTTSRPFLFNFEDEGGILPIHNVGVSASGAIPSGSLGLHYVAEVGNGRASRSELSDAVQSVVDENNHKSVNFAVFMRPDNVQGLQVGFSAYHDKLYPSNLEKIGENIFDTYAVLARANFEFLNEGVMIRHSIQGVTHVYDTPGFYTQISERFGSLRPYLRYQYVNVSPSEPVFPDVGLRTGPSAGIRYDASESVAVKLQYDYTELRKQQSVSGLALQFAFTF